MLAAEKEAQSLSAKDLQAAPGIVSRLELFRKQDSGKNRSARSFICRLFQDKQP
jgi:hypothetical protein